MKSLEIVNKEIELIHNQLNDYDEEDEEYGFYPSYDTLMYESNNYNKIKQDLEVLDILKKYLYIVEKQIPRTDDYFEILESDLDEMQDDENCDDFHKVKQWLEEN